MAMGKTGRDAAVLIGSGLLVAFAPEVLELLAAIAALVAL